MPMVVKKFESMVKNLAAHASSCPVPTIELAIRDVAIDVCTRALLWRYELAPIKLVRGQHEYEFVPPEGTEVEAVEHFNLRDGRIFRATLDVIKYRFPNWPTKEPDKDWGPPELISEIGIGSFVVAPVPDKEYTIEMIAALKPTDDADGMDAKVLSSMSKAIFHGALQILLHMPGKGWTSSRIAKYHGSQFTYHLSLLRARTNVGQFNSSVVVKHVGFF